LKGVSSKSALVMLLVLRPTFVIVLSQRASCMMTASSPSS